MNKLRLLLVTVLFIAFFTGIVFPSSIISVTNKYADYELKRGLKVIIEGRDAEGNTYRKTKYFEKDRFFANGYYFEADTLGVPVCYFVFEKYGKFYIAGFLTMQFPDEGDEDDQVYFYPNLMTDWGFDLEKQKIYIDCDLEKLPEISGEYVKPFHPRMIREKFLFKAINQSSKRHLSALSKELKSIE
ncbi:hypothetical protein KAJ27_04265 [bacterium]|nr:hypothetical protein [bacterium]